MVSCVLNFLSNLIHHVTGPTDDIAAETKALLARRDAKVKALSKQLSTNLKGGSRVAKDRAERLYEFIEAEEKRLGLTKKGQYSPTDIADLMRPLLPVESETLIQTLDVNDEVEGMKLLKWELYQVAYLKSPGGVSPIELQKVFEEKGGDYEEHLVHGFRSKIFIDFGTIDPRPIVVINMQFQPINGTGRFITTIPPAYSDHAMPPRYSVDEKGASAGATDIDVEKGMGAGIKGSFYGVPTESLPGPANIVRGVLGRKIGFEAREVKKEPWAYGPGRF